MHLSRRRRLFYGYLTADMTYVLLTKRFPHPAEDAETREAQEAYWLGNVTLNWTSWAGMSLLGIALANAIPPSWGLSFAGILALVGVLSSLATTRLRVVAAIVSGGVAVAAFALPLKLNMLVAIAASVAVCLLLEKPDTGLRRTADTKETP